MLLHKTMVDVRQTNGRIYELKDKRGSNDEYARGDEWIISNKDRL